jgi:hypothetical protein
MIKCEYGIFLKILLPEMHVKDNMVTAENIYEFIMTTGELE